MQFKRSHAEASIKRDLVRMITGLCLTGFLALTPALAQSPAIAPAAKSGSGAAKAIKPATALLDINSASLAELDALKGIGEKRAADIVKGRPYKGKDELVQKKIIPQGVYDGIKDQIIAKQK